MSLKYIKSWRKNHILNSFKKVVEWILRSRKLIRVLQVRPVNLIFFWSSNFQIWLAKKTSILFCNFSTLIIKCYNLSLHNWYCCDFFSYAISHKSSLNLYGYNFEKIETSYQNVDILFNSGQFSGSWKHALGI